ncbi:MAG: hypothetical protein IH889_01340 [Planctomycetes bacterium]|nr:hypothetical protein [Planctomycetota bacterium]
MLQIRDLAVVVGFPLAIASVAWAQTPQPRDQSDPRYGLLTPLPDQGAIPPIVEMLYGPTDVELAHRAKVRQYTKQLRLIRHKFLGHMKAQELRARGIAQLKEFIDPAAFMPMIEVLVREDDDVRLAMLDHFTAQGEQGQATLAWIAIYDRDSQIRYEAAERMTSPVSASVLGVLDTALRSPKHRVANNAGILAGGINALQAIPLLIFAQITADEVEKKGDLAWIAIATQRVFVARVEAIIDNNVAVFVPIPGVVSEGVIMRVMDAVVVNYRTDVHRSLVAMTTNDWGQSTKYLAYDIRQWWQWYNSEYVLFKNEQARQAQAAVLSSAGDPAPPPADTP